MPSPAGQGRLTGISGTSQMRKLSRDQRWFCVTMELDGMSGSCPISNDRRKSRPLSGTATASSGPMRPSVNSHGHRIASSSGLRARNWSLSSKKPSQFAIDPRRVSERRVQQQPHWRLDELAPTRTVDGLGDPNKLSIKSWSAAASNRRGRFHDGTLHQAPPHRGGGVWGSGASPNGSTAPGLTLTRTKKRP